ncbi:MAG: cytochrome b N-terminal domain-containing protein [Fimbriimonadaceae bacterium]|nr:cytochrome b N-terminal domain-containing protein [Fimbriimonadaceae bacterium]
MFRSDRLLATSAAGLFVLAILLIVSGWLLHMPYEPTVAGAHSSVSDMLKSGFWGFLAKFHDWGGATLIVFSGLHLFAMVLAGWYKAPHLWRWYGTVTIFVCALLFQITGHLLPFDRHAVQTTGIESAVAAQVPLVGSDVRQLMLGGEQVGQPTLSVWYFAHRWLIPILFIIGTLGSIVSHYRLKDVQENRILMFVPALVTVLLALWVPIAFGSAATPADFTSFDARPNWYTLPMHGALTMFSKVGAGWIGSAILPGLFVGYLIAIPLLAKKLTSTLIQLIFDGFLALFLVAALAFGGSPSPMTGNQDPPRQEEAPVVPNDGIRIDATLAAKGEALFGSVGCSGCHGILGTRSNGGPDLTDVWKRRQDPAWLKQFIKNPNSKKPGTVMPAFDKLTDAQLSALAEYLRKPKTRQGG